MKNTTWFTFAILAACLLPFGACGGGSSGGSGGTGGACATPAFDISGVWSINEVSTSGTPGCSGVDNYTLTATMSGNQVTVTDTSGRNYTGTMCGNVLTANVPFSYPEDGGMTTVTSSVITFASASSLSGTGTWSWTDGIDSCSGTSSATGTK